MNKFSTEVPMCIQQWAKIAMDCKGEEKCIDLAAKQLRECLDRAFPSSKKVEVESDKINYIISSVFLLANRLSKSIGALAELDNAISTLHDKDEKFRDKIDEIIAKYF
jgi:CII-binding regulator of phage lambda lysogenization HflD